MADRVLLITWNEPVRGRETRAVECFNEAVGILGRKQQEGAIEGFDIVFCAPTSVLAGFMKIEGTAEQLAALKEDPDFQRNTTESLLTVDGINHIDGYTGDGIAAQMTLYQETVGKLPQFA